MEIFEDKYLKKNNKIESKNKIVFKEKTRFLMKINIKTNFNPENLFQSIHHSVKEFVSQWMVSSVVDQIRFEVIRKSVKAKQEKTYPLNHNPHDHQNKQEIICAFCGNSFFYYFKKTDSCSNCTSENFLIENQFAILKIVDQGKKF